MKRIMTLAILISFFSLSESPLYARDALCGLQKMVGYTIINADTVNKVFEREGEKFIKLSGGQVFKVNFLVIDPFILTDVIVFAKALPKEVIQKYQGKLPERLLNSYKLLIDNEVYDATAQ